MLDPVHADLVNIIRDYLLEGTQSTKNIKAELCKLNDRLRYAFDLRSLLYPL
jgi:hypothetical protein